MTRHQPEALIGRPSERLMPAFRGACRVIADGVIEPGELDQLLVVDLADAEHHLIAEHRTIGIRAT